jgi:hypothetical protein
MARAAQYIVIDDPNLYGFNAELNFQVPFNCYLNRPAILTWMMNLSMNDGEASVDVAINAVPSYNGKFSNGIYQPMQEVINPNVLLWGKNMIFFNSSSTASSWFTAIISDIVLWIEVNA